MLWFIGNWKPVASNQIMSNVLLDAMVYLHEPSKEAPLLAALLEAMMSLAYGPRAAGPPGTSMLPP